MMDYENIIKWKPCIDNLITNNFSKSTTLDLVDQVLKDHDSDVLKMKDDIETMWKNNSSKRDRKTVAARDVPGFCLFGDNIGNTSFDMMRMIYSVYKVHLF